MRRVDPAFYFEPFGRNPTTPEPPFRVVWTGFIEAEVSGPHRFITLLEGDEHIRIKLAGKVVHVEGTKPRIDKPTHLRAGQRYPIEIEYTNQKDRAQLKLLWQNPAMERHRIPSAVLYP